MLSVQVAATVSTTTSFTGVGVGSLTELKIPVAHDTDQFPHNNLIWKKCNRHTCHFLKAQNKYPHQESL